LTAQDKRITMRYAGNGKAGCESGRNFRAAAALIPDTV
jgi:hypothetical protein